MIDHSPLLVLTNAKAGKPDDGQASLADRIRQAFQGHGIEAEVRPTHGEALTAAAQQAVREGKYRRIVAAGGDGTVSAVAQALAGTDVMLGVLPQGTLNHFAKDLGLPLELEAGVAAIATGTVRQIDAAEVNGRVFINNSSIGLYPHMVSKRDRQMERLGRGKWMALVLASAATFRRHLNLRVHLEVRSGDEGRRSAERVTPFVFVGNNPYTMQLFNLGGRQSLDQGKLCLYAACRGGRLAMLALAVRAIFGRLEQSRDFVSTEGEEVQINTSKKTVRVSVDGEVERMTPPLRYCIRPGALRVIVPAPPSA